VLMDEAGNVLATGRAGPSNPGRAGFENAISAMKSAAQSAIAGASVKPARITSVCAGVAGTGDPEIAKKMRSELATAFPGAFLKTCTDLEIALFAAGEGPVIVLVAGTGSAAVGRGLKGERRRTGGLGPKNGDVGSATDVGKKAVTAAKLQRENTGEETDLGKRLLVQLGITSWRQLEGPADSKDAEIYPRLFPVIANAADAGDPMACELLRGATGALAGLVTTLIDALSFREVPFRIATTGGMIGHCAFFDAELDKRLRDVAPSAKIGSLPVLPAHAAALMALEFVAGRKSSGDQHG
jgi:glucosamine kinase